MKKLLLSVLFFVGGGLISFSADITGPRYRLEGSFGFVNDKIAAKSKFFSGSISVLPEWKKQVSEKFDITFGPKATINVNFIDHGNSPAIWSNVLIGGEVDFNYRVKNNVKIYLGLEAGTGIGFQKFIKNTSASPMSSSGGSSSDNKPTLEFASISKIAFGIKLKDRYNMSIYTGDIKALLGVELGYTF
ncbi:hypothetical protein [Streptobacillus ratti]|uniref:hypothetical protein n=1 Tax=Streptobacillus ratti TaxID=1720557 RepID=UPI0009331B29|nr:hypothetical protein [Streptobacillus ratti]